MEDRQRPKPTGTNRPTQTHTPTPPHTKDRGGRTREGTPHPPHTGGPRTEHEPASTMQTTTNPPPPPNKRRRGPEDHNHPQHHRAARAPHTPPHVSVVIAGRQRPDPSRTRKLRPPAPMVLRPPGRGRAGHHRAHTTPPPPTKTAANGGGNKQQHKNAGSRDLSPTTGRLIQKQIPPQPKDHIHVPGQARQSVALPQCTFSW